jgi:hypothetical protein
VIHRIERLIGQVQCSEAGPPSCRMAWVHEAIQDAAREIERTLPDDIVRGLRAGRSAPRWTACRRVFRAGYEDRRQQGR